MILEIRRYQHDKDFKILNDLRLKRNLEKTPEKEIPILGLVVTDKSTVVGMGFLRKCEGDYGILDSVITNPDCNSEQRHKALDMIFTEIIYLSKTINIYNLIGFSSDWGMIRRSYNFGFKKSDHHVLSLSIGG